LLRSLPVQEPDRLVNLSAPGPDQKPGSTATNLAVGDGNEVFSYPMFKDLEKVQTSFTGIAAHRPFRANIASQNITLNVRGVLVSGRYFPILGVQAALGRPLLSGREFDRTDAAGSRKVTIVNEAFIKKFNLGREAIGKHIGDSPRPDMEIVGVVQNSKYLDVRETVPPLFFYPYRQADEVKYLTFYVRTSLNPELFLTNIVKLMARLDPNLPMENLHTMPQQVRESIFKDRVIAILSGVFACLATLLAAVGLYGMLAYAVAQRTREIGVRIALGASRTQIRAMVLRQVGVISLIGGAVGLVLAVTLGRLAQSLLFNLQGTDPWILCSSIVVVELIAVASGLIPAWRASKLDPIQALRES
jgi:hypothetical protein